MEDQQADPGDLTTDAEPPVQTRDAAESSRRTPLRRQLEGDGNPDTAVDVPSQASEVATEVTEETIEQPQAKVRRRWFSLRRGPKTAEPEAVSASDEAAESEDTEPAPRRPVGKSRRVARVSQPVAEQSDEAVATEAAEAVETEAAEAVETEAAEAGTPAETFQDSEEPAEDVIMVPHRPAGKRLLIAATAAAVLFVACAAFAGATLQPYLASRATVDTKLDVARTAASAISTLWTYTPDNMEALPDRAANFLGGDFAEEYRKYIDAIVAPNKQAQVSNTTQVMGAAVESLNATEATALVYTNSVATSPVTKNIPSLRYLSYRLTMQRHESKWLITHMSTVTQFDLTPQL